MPYTMTDEVTGDRFEFDDKFPTDKARDLIMSKRPGAGSKPPFLRGQQGGPTPPPMIEGSIDVSGEDLPTVKDVVSGVMPVVRPTVEGTAAAVGGMVGARRGGVKGALAGAGTLYAGAKGVMDAIEEKIGTKPTPSVVGRVLETGKDYLTGAGIEAGGQTGGKILETGLKVGGKLSKALMGRITGTGTGAVDEALAAGKSTTGTNWFETKSGFDRAMRGDITGDEIVQTAQSAIRNVRLQRATAYQKELEKVGGINRSLDISPVRRKMGELLDRYGLVYTVAEDGERVLKPKFTGSSLNKVDLNKVEEMVDTVMRWGKKKGDRTPVGVDTLKRYLDNFYSDSSAIRQMTASMRSEVNGVLTRNIPEYARMTKGYAEATNLIKDIESGLMLRKQGMSGRVTADQTLRRLVSAMKDNNELRKDLLTVLGNKSGVNELTGQVAGYTMSQVLPRGLAGETPFLIGEVAMAYKLLNPRWWPLLAMSSPRVAGEFLRIIGRTAVETAGASPRVGKASGYGATYGASRIMDRKTFSEPGVMEGAVPSRKEYDNTVLPQ